MDLLFIFLGVVASTLALLGVYFLLAKHPIHYLFNALVLAFPFWLNLELKSPEGAIVAVLSASIYLCVVFLQDKSSSSSSSKEYAKVQVGHNKIKNVFAGVYVGGAAGSGKTRAIICQIMKHFGRHNFGGIVYAYKNFELVRYGLPLYGEDKSFVFAPNSPEITVKVNPLDPSYFRDESEIKEFFLEMAANLKRKKGSDDTSSFFDTAAIGLLTGVTLIMAKKYPSFCSLPHVAALCLMADHDKMVAFLKGDPRAIIQANTYITSTDRQLSGVQGTIANFLGSFATPNVFFSLYDRGGKYVSLKVNSKNNPFHLFLVNDIANEGVVLPVVNSITYLAMRLLSKGFEQGDTIPSYLLIDEGSTLNLQGFSRKPATLRSFDVATVFSIQDLSLGIEAAGEATIRAICSNLSYHYYGKVMDDKTAEFYERMSPYVMKKHVSRTSGTGVFSGLQGSATVSEKEQKKFRAPDFRSLGTGEFVSFVDGKCVKEKYNYTNGIKESTINPIREINNDAVQKQYDEILDWAKTFLG